MRSASAFLLLLFLHSMCSGLAITKERATGLRPPRIKQQATGMRPCHRLLARSLGAMPKPHFFRTSTMVWSTKAAARDNREEREIERKETGETYRWLKGEEVRIPS
jgi:hypothetical protein